MFKVISNSLKTRHLYKFYNSFFQEISGKRTFLSQSYNCLQEWNRRFETPIIKNVDLDLLYHEVRDRFNQSKVMSVLDVDMLVNATKKEHYLEELQDLIHKLRLTKSTMDTFESTQHGFIRLLLDHDRIDDLHDVLDDRLNYGIFPDDYCSILLMDHFIKKKDFVGAAKIGILQMLQEDWSHPLTTQMSFYSCYHYLKNPLQWKEKEEEPPEEDSKEDSKEPELVRVKFLRNPFFDDHFDLTDPNHLTGKSLAWGGMTMQNAIGNTYQAIGWCYYQKWPKLIEFLNYLKENPDQKIYKQAVTMINEYFEKTKDESLEETKNQILSLLNSFDPTQIDNEDFEKIIENELTKCVSENEEDLINKQKQLYSDWEVNREKVFQENLEKNQQMKRLEEIEKEKKDLKEREDVLYFFENEEKWDLVIDKKKVFYPKKYLGRKKAKRDPDDQTFVASKK